MDFVEGQPTKLEASLVIKDVLGVAALDLVPSISAAEQNGSDALRELGLFLRRVLEVVLEIGDRRDLTLYLKPEDPAQALEALLSWSLAQPYRRSRNLPFVMLGVAPKNGVDRPVRIGRRFRAMSVEQLVAEYDRKAHAGDGGDTRKTSKAYPVSIAGMVRAHLNLDPESLHLYRSGLVASQNPEERSQAGLEALVMDVLAQYAVMRERRTTRIRLMSEDDARDAQIPEAAAAHFTTLLAAALHAGDKQGVFFMPPRPRTIGEKAMLREAAKVVYLDYSDEALGGLERICDGVVHFGHGANHTIVERLLYDVARECDPGLQRMPSCVASQLTLMELTEIG